MIVETNLKFLLLQKLLNRSSDTFISWAIKLWWSKYFCSAFYALSSVMAALHKLLNRSEWG